jgi:hypothetical protein
MAKEILTIEVEVRDDLEAYRLLNRINFEFKVLNSKYKGQNQKYDAGNLPKNFLKKKGEFLTDKQLEHGAIE